MSFHVKDGYLYCESLRITEIRSRIAASPFYLYSAKQIADNYNAYLTALDGVTSIVSYAFKANSNLTILKRLRELGSGAVLVSGNELRLAMAAGFDTRRTLFNGNGKTVAELTLAVEHGVMINIDSKFDLEHIERAASTVGKSVDVLIRINPDVDPDVHPYVSTGIRNSKFGICNEHLPWFLDRISGSSLLNLVGIHCHLGSTIKRVQIFRDATTLMMEAMQTIRGEGFDPRYLNIGGGLDIDYERTNELPTKADLIDSIRDLLTDDVTLIIEPGRSIVGSGGVLVGTVIGTKTNANRGFIVTDCSMAELIRPSLYNAYHHIGFVEPVGGDVMKYDIVGPVCESADFLGKDRMLPKPPEGAGVVVYDAGAYGYSMSSNYNVRMRPPEYLVDGDQLIHIRRAEDFGDYVQLFDTDENGRPK